MSNQEKKTLIEEVGRVVTEEQDARDAVDEAAAERLGVNRSDLRCVGLLLFRGPMTAGELAEAVGLSPSAVTTVLDRLERARQVRRVRDTVDRRRVLVEVTPEARERVEEIWGPIAQAGRVMLQRYSVEELVLIRDMLRRSRDLQLEHAARIRRLGAPPASAAPGGSKKERKRGQ
jgi:DNA-binding MarR family transcriptional regulator